LEQAKDIPTGFQCEAGDASPEIATYFEYCPKPGKALGPDKCPNERLKTMSDEKFLLVQAWLNEILTLPEKPIDTARQSRSTMDGTISQLHKGGSTNKTSNLLEPEQGGGRQGRSVNINVPKIHFVTMKPTDKESESIESTSTSETPSMQCRRQLSDT